MAGHAFLNDHEAAGDRSPLSFVVMGKFAGPTGYHAPSARDTRASPGSTMNGAGQW